MLLNFLIWFDLRILRCRWRWFCDWTWDRQMERDIQRGTFPMPTEEELAEVKLWDVTLMDGLED